MLSARVNEGSKDELDFSDDDVFVTKCNLKLLMAMLESTSNVTSYYARQGIETSEAA
jgi:hypothetical protein